jgi:hypothetical protein
MEALAQHMTLMKHAWICGPRRTVLSVPNPVLLLFLGLSRKVEVGWLALASSLLFKT